MRLHPVDQRGQHLFDLHFVANEVVINDEHATPPTQLVNRLQLFNQLVRTLYPRSAAV